MEQKVHEVAVLLPVIFRRKEPDAPTAVNLRQASFHTCILYGLPCSGAKYLREVDGRFELWCSHRPFDHHMSPSDAEGCSMQT